MTTLVLVGAGHAHAQVLLELARQRPKGLKRLLVVSPHALAPYSGMVPGWMAGHYSWEECCIDFEGLCRLAGAELVLEEVLGLDARAQRLTLQSGATLDYDRLSMNIGSTLYPPCRGDGVLPLRPLAELKTGWDAAMERTKQLPGASIVMVGGGAAGVESILATFHALDGGTPGCQHRFTLATQGGELVPGLSPLAARLLADCLDQRGIRVLTNFMATRIEDGRIHAADARPLRADLVLWATGAQPHEWTASTALEKDQRGFIRIDHCLRSTSHASVFAAGDCAGWETPLPKAGVYAVRMGPTLAHNLRAAIEGRPLRAYQPQRRFLVLVGTGNEEAVGSWGPLGWKAKWAWRWKERIDRTFLARYRSAAAAPRSSKAALQGRGT